MYIHYERQTIPNLQISTKLSFMETSIPNADNFKRCCIEKAYPMMSSNQLTFARFKKFLWPHHTRGYHTPSTATFSLHTPIPPLPSLILLYSLLWSLLLSIVLILFRVSKEVIRTIHLLAGTMSRKGKLLFCFSFISLLI